jgi:hypothetical protein
VAGDGTIEELGAGVVAGDGVAIGAGVFPPGLHCQDHVGTPVWAATLPALQRMLLLMTPLIINAVCVDVP